MDYLSLDNSQPATVILCSNKLFFGNKYDYVIVFSTWFAYISLSILFFVCINPFVMEEYSFGLGIFSYFLSLPGIYFAVKCFSTDPGILKRGNLTQPEGLENDNPHPYVQDNGIIDNNTQEPHQELKEYQAQQQQSTAQESTFERESQLEESAQNNKILLNEQMSNGNNQQLNIQNNGQQVQMQEIVGQVESQVAQQEINQINHRKRNLLHERYCRTCKVMRPPFASHCNHCNNCVKTFDHHCFFMGNCIGERNQKYFILFLITTAVWAFYVETFTILNTIEAIQLNDTLIYDIIYNEFLIYPFLALGVLCVLAVMVRCHQCMQGWLFLAFTADAVVITVYSYLENKEVALSDNPILSLVMCGVYVGVILFVTPQACFNTNLACKSMTQKQEVFYHTYADFEQAPSTFANLWKLLTKPSIKSEIIS